MLIRIAKLGSRNRVVLPPEAMEALGVGPGDAVFFLIDPRGVRLSRSPETFSEYLQLHAGALPSFDAEDDVDPDQMRFDWYQEDD
ncbi:MAG: AbrB/MazE/SpoVT family DNA-binding domain-containing protein [Anaerolineae bacterium]